MMMTLSPLFESAFELVKRGGWIMLPIFLTGWWAWLLIFERTYQLWLHHGISRKRFWHVLDTQGLDSAKTLIGKGRGAFDEMALRVMAVSQFGNKAVHNEIQRVAVERSNALQRHLRTISRLAGLAPLLGLLGTVSGIVHTFDSIQQVGFGNPVILAAGISEALLATQAGLLVAFPIAICYNLILHRVERLEILAPAEALRLAAWMDRHAVGSDS
jgi:biopolymer transport protein ExbB